MHGAASSVDLIEGADHYGECAGLLRNRTRPPVLIKIHGCNAVRAPCESQILYSWQRWTQRIAQWLEGHPHVRRVWYPGLDSHPDHATAKRLLRGFGGVVTFELDTDLEGTFRFTDACRLPYLAPSLGGVESLIEAPVLMSFWDKTPEERTELGMVDSLIRLACGIEDADDLQADLENAFTAI